MCLKMYYPQKIIKLGFCFVLSFFIHGELTAQRFNYYNQIKQVNESGAAPAKASMAYTLDSPVNLLTGAACFDIPIYTIKEGRFSYPISIRYQTSGFKVVDLASNVGLGWSIMAGGCISRTVKGFIDEAPQVGYCSQVGDAHNIHEAITELAQIDNFGSELLTTQDVDRFATLLYITDNLYDAEPDIYSFNFCGYSGSFIFDMDGNIHLIPEQNYDIQKTEYGFVITVDNGDKYYFGEGNSKEIVRNTYNCPLFMTINDFETPYADNYYNLTLRHLINNYNHPQVKEPDQNYPIAWFLSRIELSENHKNIFFDYETDDVRVYLGTDETYMRGQKFQTPENYSFVGGFDWIVNRVNRYRFLNMPRLRSVLWDNGTIEFVPSPYYREDLDYKGSANGNDYGGYSIKRIVISSTNDEFDYSEHFTIDLNQQYYTDNQAHGNFPQVGCPDQFRPYYKRLLLDSIVFMDLNGNVVKNYSFTYNYYRPSYCPTRNSCEVDYWGYFKPRDGINVERYAIKPTIYYYQDGENNPLYKSDYSIWLRSGEEPTCIFEGHDLSPNPNTAKLFTLKTVSLPTGGIITFDYELNDFFFDNQDISGPGVRVKSVSFNSLQGGDYRKEYTYKNGAHSSGRISYIPNIGMPNLFPLNNDGYLPTSNHYERINYLTARQFSTSTDIYGTNQSQVQYEKIIETCKNNNNNIGKTIYYNQLNLTASDQTLMIGENCFVSKTRCKWTSLYQHPNYPSLENPYYENVYHLMSEPTFTFPIISWYDGFLIKKELYNNDNKLVESTEYQYHLKPSEDFVLYIQSKYLFKYITAWIAFDDQQMPQYSFPIYQYDILWGVNYYKTGVRLLDTIIHKYYSEGDDNLANVTTQTFDYNDNNYVSVEKTENSDGCVIKQTYSYPFEYYTWHTNPVYSNMIERNMLNSVVEQYTTVNNKVTHGLYCKFKAFGTNNSFIKPEKLYKLRTTSPLSNFHPTVTQTGQDSHYELTDEMRYDHVSGNLVEVWDENDGKTTYVWGFHNSLLLAKIQNATDSEVRNALNCTIEALQEKTDTEELIGIFQALRAALPNAMVTSYTYDLFQNLVSITDPSGKTSRYEYDDALRLKLTRDVENNILQKYEYHYYNQ